MNSPVKKPAGLHVCHLKRPLAVFKAAVTVFLTNPLPDPPTVLQSLFTITQSTPSVLSAESLHEAFYQRGPQTHTLNPILAASDERLVSTCFTYTRVTGDFVDIKRLHGAAGYHRIVRVE